MSASFDGIDLQIVEEMQSMPAPKSFQKSGYPGVDGVERLDMGARGKVHRAKVVLAGVNAADLGYVLQTLGGYVLDGGAYTLVDVNGTAWANTILTEFRPVGPRFNLASSPFGICQRCELVWEDDI